jgi:hypothetical protein
MMSVKSDFELWHTVSTPAFVGFTFVTRVAAAAAVAVTAAVFIVAASSLKWKVSKVTLNLDIPYLLLHLSALLLSHVLTQLLLL